MQKCGSLAFAEIRDVKKHMDLCGSPKSKGHTKILLSLDGLNYMC